MAELFSSRAVLLVFAALFYAGRLSHGSLDLFGPNWFGLVFNDMLDRLLHGRWDIDPALIGNEAFVRDGRSYTYFGPFPALLRVPFALLVPEWRNLHVERLSCLVAITVGIAAQLRAMSGALATISAPLRRVLAPPLLLACTLSGVPMLLSWKGAAIYQEAILWAWALATSFVAIALPAIGRSGTVGWRRLCGLAACAGLCLLTRSSIGVGLVLIASVLIGRELVRTVALPGRAGDRWRAVAPAFVPAMVLGALVGLAGIVNAGRWGNPFTFADVQQQVFLIEAYPDRVARLARHGLFDWRRVATGLMYYVLPVWTAGLERVFPLADRLTELYDAVERPASSLLLTDPAWCVLSFFGVRALVRGRGGAGSALLVGGLSVAPLGMLMAWYLAFRYRAEFAPLLLALSCIGLRDRWGAGCGVGRVSGREAAARGAGVLALLCSLQVGVAAFAGRSYALQSYGPSPGYEGVSLHCAAGWGCPDSPDVGEDF